MFEEKTLAKLQDAVKAIYEKKSFDTSEEELYRVSAFSLDHSLLTTSLHSSFQSVESLCLHKKEGEVYSKLYNQCKARVESVISSLSGRSFFCFQTYRFLFLSSSLLRSSSPSSSFFCLQSKSWIPLHSYQKSMLFGKITVSKR
jgi:hypothetical protein